MNEKTATITKETDGKEEQVEVRVRYCAAVETGFEQLRGKSISTLSPESPEEDWIALGLSAIVAAYEYRKEQPPVDSHDILYTAKPSELMNLFTAVMELRAEWYKMPDVIAGTDKPSKARKSKN